MTYTGSSRVTDTGFLFPKRDPLLFKWLDDRNVKWRVYHDGLSFFGVLGRISALFGPNFRAVERLAIDWLEEDPGDSPQVIIVEPSYESAPRIPPDQPNDNHAPLPVGFGEQFIRRIYDSLTINPDKWSKTVMILTHDEHGGFYDHVPPLPISYQHEEEDYPPFTSTGPRVPSLVISPLVSAKRVFSGHLDHTSILQFLAERFAPGEAFAYSPDVQKRKDAGILSVSRVLNRTSPRVRIPQMPNETMRSLTELGLPEKKTKEPIELLFEQAALDMIREFPEETKERFPRLWHWHLLQKAQGD